MSKSVSLLWAGISVIAVIVAGIILVGLGLRYDRSEVWQFGAVLILGGAGALGVKAKIAGKAMKLLLMGLVLVGMAGCICKFTPKTTTIGVWPGDGKFEAPGFLGLKMQWRSAIDDEPTTQPAHR
jgi:hypothetical protein